MLRRLLAPSAAIRDTALRGRARLTAAVLLVLTLVGLVSAVTASGVLEQLLLISAGVSLLGYAVSRTRAPTAGGVLAVAACALVPYAGMFTETAQTSAVTEVMWLVVSVLVGGLCLAPRALIPVLAIHVAVVFGLLVSNHAIPLGATTQVTGFLTAISGLAVVSSAVRTSQERRIARRTEALEQAAAALRAEVAFADDILAAMGDMLIVLGPDGRVELANRALCEVLGYRPDELRGRPVTELIHEGPGADAEEESVARLITEWVPGVEVSLLPRRGDPIPVLFRGTPLQDDDGALAGMVGVARDLRETRALLAARDAAEQERERAEEWATAHRALAENQLQRVHASQLTAVGRLASAVAHQINNPLTAILIAAVELEEAQEGGDIPDRYRDAIEMVLHQTERCTSVVTGLYDFAGREGAKDHTLDLREVAHTALTLAHPALRNAGATVRVLMPKPLPVRGSRVELGQVVYNLLINAGQATGEGGVIWLRGSRDDDHVRLAVQDTGRGIPEEIQDRVFEPFFTTAPRGERVGLGLALCHGIVRSHEGTIEMESTPGRGSTFTVTLPRVEPED